MWKYIVRRLLQMIPIIIGISIIIFLIVHLVPGNFIEAQGRASKMSPAELKHLEDLYGLNDPLWLAYFKWIKGIVLHLDLGDSFTYHLPVTSVLGTFILTSLKITIPALIIEILVAIPLGIISATKQYTKTDFTLTFIAFLGISCPTFFLVCILQNIFAINLGIMPMSGLVTPGTNYTGFSNILDQAYHLAMPVFTIAFISIGSMMRYTRMSMLEVINQDYIRTARAKGLSERKVIYKHAFRNTLIPIVTLLGLSLPGLISGALISETLFGIPGIGYTSFKAINNRDYPFLMGFCLLVAAVTLISNLISDICYALVDPRVKLK